MNYKKILLSSVFFAQIAFVSAQEEAPKNWFNLDLSKDKIRGVSTERAYKELLKGKKSSTIVVAVIDSGIEIDHPSLKKKLWINEKEKNGKSGVDDDNNGYIDDVYGWDFIGGKDGKDVEGDSYELTRVYAKLKNKTNRTPEEEKLYEKVKADFEKKSTENATGLMNVMGLSMAAQPHLDYAKKFLKKPASYDISKKDIPALLKGDIKAKEAGEFIGQFTNDIPNFESDVRDYLKQLQNGSKYSFNLVDDVRKIVGDNYENPNEKGYGNAEVEGPHAEHGTHVAGIIAGDRKSKIFKGVAENVKIMTLRAVPDGDERDKDIANAIRYAVDNGAKVINMSFGKSYSPYKSVVDDAVRHAESKGVLLVHAAGNDSKNIEENDNFPTKRYADGTIAKNWIEVGASDWKNSDKGFVANFSNYGQNDVDIFAPGVDIYSSVPDAKYKPNSGTSMASPVVAGVAALVWSYYPNLTALQIKEILLKSATIYKDKEVNMPGEKDKTVLFGKLSNTGGIVNVYDALKMAEKLK